MPQVDAATCYDVIVGNLSDLQESRGTIDLGSPIEVVCGTTEFSAEDMFPDPTPEAGLFYLQRIHTSDAFGDYGISSSCSTREAADICPETCP